MNESDGIVDALLRSKRAPSVFTAISLLLVVLSYSFLNVQLALVFVVCVGSATSSVWTVRWLLNRDTGDEESRFIATAIREGSDAFFGRVYGTIAKLLIPVAAFVFATFAMRGETTHHYAQLGHVRVALVTTACFLFGAFCSCAAGYIGLWTSVRANVRVAAAAGTGSTQNAIVVGLRGASIASTVVVFLVVFGIASLFVVADVLLVQTSLVSVSRVPMLLVGFGFGASFVALFAQLGGGIFTKAADVGADLVGKVERHIPEDDPRNPAVIADLVGDNVGDCSARGADLFESVAAEIVSAMILGGVLSERVGMSPVETKGFILFPLIVHAFDLMASAIGVFSVSSEASQEHEDHPVYRTVDDPMIVLKKGWRVSMFVAFLGITAASRWLLYVESAPSAWAYYACCGYVGMLTAYASITITQYYTDTSHRPVKAIFRATETGHATTVIEGLAVGMESTGPAVLLVCCSLLTCYWLGGASGLTDSQSGLPLGGLFGTAVGTMGMLSTAGYVLSMDVFGPIADNAGGIVEMSGKPEEIRLVTDQLDAVGNTTKAATKGYAVGSACLASFLLFRAFMDEVESYSNLIFDSIPLTQPEVFVSGLLGGTLVFVFSGMAMMAVGETAQDVVKEVRRQFDEKPGILRGTERPEYGACVDIVAAAALRTMVKPGLLATISPIAIGLIFKLLCSNTDPLMASKCVGGFLMFTTATGILMSLFMNNAGGAMDNAKKLVELSGKKGTPAHDASITGDTLGDPLKDTAGPSLHVLIKLTATVSLVLCPLFV